MHAMHINITQVYYSSLRNFWKEPISQTFLTRSYGPMYIKYDLNQFRAVPLYKHSVCSLHTNQVKLQIKHVKSANYNNNTFRKTIKTWLLKCWLIFISGLHQFRYMKVVLPAQSDTTHHKVAGDTEKVDFLVTRFVSHDSLYADDVLLCQSICNKDSNLTVRPHVVRKRKLYKNRRVMRAVGKDPRVWGSSPLIRETLQKLSSCFMFLSQQDMNKLVHIVSSVDPTLWRSVHRSRSECCCCCTSHRCDAGVFIRAWVRLPPSLYLFILI